MVGEGEDVPLGFHVAPDLLPHALSDFRVLLSAQKPCNLLVVVGFRELQELHDHEGEIVRDEGLLDKVLQQALQLSTRSWYSG